MSGKVYPLQGAQRDAVDPRESVWLSASAGTGKTQVLSARVLRLLLEPGADPSQILCLTFTKAGAAEMAVRVNEVLARWVRLDDGLLAKDLANLGAATDPGNLLSVAAISAPKSKVTGPITERMTLTYPAVARARSILLMMSGDKKKTVFDAANPDHPVSKMRKAAGKALTVFYRS